MLFVMYPSYFVGLTQFGKRQLNHYQCIHYAHILYDVGQNTIVMTSLH